MLSLTLAAILHTAAASTGGTTYADAHRANVETGKPLMILVGADWCPACRQMKNQSLPVVQRRGLLNKVAFAVVNTDRESRLASRLMQGSSMPQLIMYRKTSDGWRRSTLIGVQSPDAIERFIGQAIQPPPETADSRKASAQIN